MTTIITKNGSGAPTTGDLQQGELAVDLTNKRLYTEATVGGVATVIEIGTNPTEATIGDLTATGTVDLSSATVSNGGTVTTVDIDGGTVDDTVIGATTAAAGTFTDLTADTSLTAATADIDGGTIDDTAIGATTASTGAFTTLSADTSLTAAGLSYPASDGTADQVLVTDGAGNLSFADASSGGVDGIVSTATGTAITINSSDKVGIGAAPANDTQELQVSGSGIKLLSSGGDYMAGSGGGGFYGFTASTTNPVTSTSDTFLKTWNSYDPGASSATSGSLVIASGDAYSLYVEPPDIFLGNATSGDVEIYTGNATAGQTTTRGKLYLQNELNAGIEIERSGDTTIKTDTIVLSNLPTSDPTNAGQLWNDSGTLKVSAG